MFSFILSALTPTLFPFFRHTIPSVRLAVVKTHHSFLSIPTLNTEWLTTPFARLLIQNLVVEERADVRDATLTLWNLVVETLRPVEGWMEAVITQNSLFEWYSLAMTPLGVPMDTSTVPSFRGPQQRKWRITRTAQCQQKYARPGPRTHFCRNRH